MIRFSKQKYNDRDYSVISSDVDGLLMLREAINRVLQNPLYIPMLELTENKNSLCVFLELSHDCKICNRKCNAKQIILEHKKQNIPNTKPKKKKSKFDNKNAHKINID